MRKSGELISVPYRGIFPVHVNLYHYESSILHWHPETELFFVLSGSAEVFVEDTSYTAQKEDVFLINANDLHQVSSADGEVLSLRFHIKMLPYMDSVKEQRFDLNSSGNTNRARYDFIRHLIAQFVKINSQGEHTYKTISMVFAIYSHLTENFLAAPNAKASASHKNHERINTIIDYMEEHYAECLSLSDIAESQNLSVPYLSSYFERNTGKTILTYYNDIRLTHAVHAMLTTDESLEQIALKNGFNDTRAFTSLFKKKYKVLPSVYRKKNSALAGSSLLAADEAIEETARQSVEKARTFQSLAKYLSIYNYNQEASLPALLASSSRTIDAGIVSMAASGIGLSHTYHKLMCVGSAKQFLYQEVQDMVRMAQKEIHYDYVKFHGLLSDDMMAYTETEDGSPIYTFLLIDKAIDFMLSVDLRPFCQFSFMPIALASNPGRMVDMGHFNTSPPKDMQKWINLIEALMKHFIKRYGIAEVRKWLFCVWNEPNDIVDEFSWFDRERFFDFYEQTYRIVKKLDTAFLFGTPSLLLAAAEDNHWDADFFKFCTEHHCPPDFLNIHYYDNNMFQADMRERKRDENGFSTRNMNESFPLSVNPYAFLEFINQLKHLLKEYHMKTMPVYLSEWNLTISHRDLINDTCFKACYLIKNLLENYDRLNSFGYWCLTDFIEELPLPEALYHGGLGMFTYNGIPKAHFNAFRFLNHLDDTLIGKGDGYFITKGYGRITVIVYNYEHYSKLFASGYMMDMSDQNRYAPFTEMNMAQFTVQFSDVPYQKCLIREHFINQLHGSSYDTWIRMGAQPLTENEDLESLRMQSQPGIYLHQEAVIDGLLTLHIQIAPLEVRLIEIEFQEASN